MVEVLQGLTLGDAHLKHVNNVRVTAILQQHDLSQNSSRLGQGLEQFGDLFDGHVAVVAFANCLGDVSIRPFAHNFPNSVLAVEVFGGEDFIDIVGDGFSLHWLLLGLFNLHAYIMIGVSSAQSLYKHVS